MNAVLAEKNESSAPTQGRGSQLLSIVIPCYNEKDVIDETLSRTKYLCASLNEFTMKLIFVDDGRFDPTWDPLKLAAAVDDRIKIIALINYPLRQTLRFVANVILPFSTGRLQLSIVAGLLFDSLAFDGEVYVIYVRVFTNAWVSRRATIQLSILLVRGAQLLGIGVLVDYAGRTHNEIMNRPPYVVEEYHDFGEGGVTESKSQCELARDVSQRAAQ